MKVNRQTILSINNTLDKYFTQHSSITIIASKDLMPSFIAAGIFAKDAKNGLPIRQVLRLLDNANQLHFIPRVLPERKNKNTYWFFISETSIKPVKPISTSKSALSTIKNKKPKPVESKIKDESYVIDLCDDILGIQAERQKTFDFLLGDKNENGYQVKLPVDAYYASLRIVIEYREDQHSKPNAFFDKPGFQTISGMHRGEQRRLYDERRRQVLPKNGLQLIEISYTLFTCDSRNRIKRNEAQDKSLVKRLLQKHLKTC